MIKKERGGVYFYSLIFDCKSVINVIFPQMRERERKGTWLKGGGGERVEVFHNRRLRHLPWLAVAVKASFLYNSNPIHSIDRGFLFLPLRGFKLDGRGKVNINPPSPAKDNHDRRFPLRNGRRGEIITIRTTKRLLQNGFESWASVFQRSDNEVKKKQKKGNIADIYLAVTAIKEYFPSTPLSL